MANLPTTDPCLPSIEPELGKALPILTVFHRTAYTYRRPVGFGEHRMMLRPRDTHDQRHLGSKLEITPAPIYVRWGQDVFGNCITTAGFSGRAKELVFTSTLQIGHEPRHEAAIKQSLATHVRAYPFSYDPDEMADLARLVARQYPDPQHQLDRWARSFLAGGTVQTMDLLASMTHQIKRQFTYQLRQEPGIQSPIETLGRGTGTCRDFAVLMMEAVRCLGLAARFVSGYVHSPNASPSSTHLGGGNTHAWLQVYLPGAGWIEFDPTNDIVGSRDLVRVMVVRDAQQAIPLTGTWYGQPSDYIGMEVTVQVTSSNNNMHAILQNSRGSNDPN